MPQFIEWDSLDLRVSGEKLNELARSMVVDPIQRLELHFLNGMLRIDGTAKVFMSVPFTVYVSEMTPSGTSVRVTLRAASAFGAIPIPRFLFRLAKDRLPKDLVRFEEPATFVFSLDRFLPPFVSTEIQKIWIIDGGLAVTLGRGGADLPAETTGDSHGAGSDDRR
ncbi:MAG: hypothetical protein ACXVIJ_03090 [Thermoanaerobaculia bacterium]